MLAVSLLLPAVAATPTTLLPTGSTWSYLDGGVFPGATWTTTAFDDSGWASGPAPIGYGNFVATTVSYGPDLADKHPVTWLRTHFQVADASLFDALSLELVRDDGAIVYLNGTEVGRSNVDVGATYATTDLSSLMEVQEVALPAQNLLVDGDNVLAVELHNATPQSDDLSLDLSLLGWSGTPAVVRGPYLQTVTHTAATVVWRTDAPSTSRVEYGTAVGALTSAEQQGGVRLDHAVTLDDLTPETEVTYAVGTIGTRLVGDDLLHTFGTAPVPGDVRPVRLWVIGDAGTGTPNQFAVRDGWLTYGGVADLWLMLGDNAYPSGTDADYTRGVFDVYGDHLPNTPLWPTLGNHDGYSALSPFQAGPYYDIFHLPTLGEAGGVASGTEAWYSFDWANLHFICLDSYGSDRTAASPMVQWLASDLAAASADWTIVFWHHPPYSRGSHNSDYERELVDMRVHAVPVLDAYGVDLVLSGHSHSYERSGLLDGHYGLSSTFGLEHLRGSGDGYPVAGSGYTKPTAGAGPGEGAVYTVAGSSGQVSGGQLDHPAMVVSLNELGSLVVDVDGLTLDAVFIDETGVVLDAFRIEKGVTSVLELYLLVDPIYEAVPAAMHTYAQEPDGTAVTTYAWDFGDGSVAVGADVLHTWADDGTFPVTVTATDSTGFLAVRTQDILVLNAIPIIDTMSAGPATEGNPVTFTATAHDPGNDPITYTWSFGDGSGPALGPVVQHVFLDDGLYPVVVSVADDDGGVATRELVVTVTDLPPALQGIDLSPPVEGAVVVLTAGLSEAVDWAWDFHDGLPERHGQAVDHVWPDDGVFPVTLTLTDDEGDQSSVTVDVVVTNLPPELVQVSSPDRADEGEVLAYGAVATDVPGDPLQITWSWGDLRPDGEGALATHTFGDDATFLVEVTVDDGDGGVVTEVLPVEVDNLPPTFARLVLPTTGDEGQEVELVAEVADPGADDGVDVVWTWDGVDRLGERVSLVLGPADGDLVLVVTADDGDGGRRTETAALHVHNLPPTVATPATTVPAGYAYAWSARATDPGGDPLTYTLLGPDGATVDALGTVRWFPVDAAVTEADFALVVSDGTDTVEVAWTVFVVGDSALEPGGCGCASAVGPWLLFFPLRRVRRRPLRP